MIEEDVIDYEAPGEEVEIATETNVPDVKRFTAPQVQKATPAVRPKAVRYKYGVDAVAAMNAAESWEEYNGILQANADWLSNARFSQGAQDAAKVVGHVVTSKRMSEAAALREKMQSVQFQAMQKVIDTTTKNLSELSNVDFISQAMEGIRTNGMTAEWVGKINAQHAIQKAEESSKPQSPFGKLQADLDAEMNGLNRPEVVKRFVSAIEMASTNKGKSIYMGMDDSGKPIFQMTEGDATPIGTPTVATQSMTQKKLLKYEGAMELINDLKRSIKPEFLGVKGVAGEMLVDRGLAQLAPELANRSRVDFRSGLIAARESLLREISDDNRFSNADREEISKALPSSGIFESLPDAQQRLDTVSRIISQRGKIYSSGSGLPPPIWSLTVEEIKAQHDKFKTSGGKEGIDYNTALDALTRFH